MYRQNPSGWRFMAVVSRISLTMKGKCAIMKGQPFRKVVENALGIAYRDYDK